MLGVSRKTVSRRIRHYGLLEEIPRYTAVSNENLDVIVSSIYTEFPNCGMKGFLLARGIRIQWERLRASLWRVDPEGILVRSMQLNLVRRRHYSVPDLFHSGTWMATTGSYDGGSLSMVVLTAIREG